MNICFKWDKSYKCGIIVCDKELLGLIREELSVADKTANARRRRTGNKYIPLRQYAITPTGRFGIGIFFEIYKKLVSLQIPFKISISDEFKDRFKPSYVFRDEKLISLDREARYYQLETVKKCLAQGWGTLVMATASGKSFIMAMLIQTIRKYEPDTITTIIVPDTQLVAQLGKDFIEYGINPNDICQWTGATKLDPNKKILIVDSPILMSKKQNISYVEASDLLLIDEVHKLRKKNKLNNIVKKILTKHKFGFTGTLPEDMVDQWNIIGKMGPILYEKQSHELRDEKFIADAIVLCLKLHYYTLPPPVEKINMPNTLYRNECEFLFKNEFRNQVIAKICNKIEKNTLIMVDRIVHGEILFETIKKQVSNKKVYWIRGEMPVKDREEIRKLMEKTDNIICIAISKIFSTGINIKNLHYIIFASAGKAKIKILQSIGRGLRLHKNKYRLTIIDIVDNLKYGMKHFDVRRLIYEADQLHYEIKEIYEKKNN